MMAKLSWNRGFLMAMSQMLVAFCSPHPVMRCPDFDTSPKKSTYHACPFIKSHSSAQELSSVAPPFGDTHSHSCVQLSSVLPSHFAVPWLAFHPCSLARVLGAGASLTADSSNKSGKTSSASNAMAPWRRIRHVFHLTSTVDLCGNHDFRANHLNMLSC